MDTGDSPGNGSGADGDGSSSVRQTVAAIILLGALIAASLWLTGAMRGAATIQDCVASGRTNCAPIRQ